MLDQLFSQPGSLIVYFFALISAISIHEFSHALTADRLGDPTPRLQGRLTLDPRSHLDPYGLLFMLLFRFGWGKPVQFDPFNLKSPRRDAALISLAGPGSNLLLATILALLFHFFPHYLILPFITINVMLGIFNLLPIHPLDGFKIFGGFLSEERAREWYQLERYGMIFLIFLILPFGKGQTMLGFIFQPIIGFILGVLIPNSLSSGIL